MPITLATIIFAWKAFPSCTTIFLPYQNTPAKHNTSSQLLPICMHRIKDIQPISCISDQCINIHISQTPLTIEHLKRKCTLIISSPLHKLHLGSTSFILRCKLICCQYIITNIPCKMENSGGKFSFYTLFLYTSEPLLQWRTSHLSNNIHQILANHIAGFDILPPIFSEMPNHSVTIEQRGICFIIAISLGHNRKESKSSSHIFNWDILNPPPLKNLLRTNFKIWACMTTVNHGSFQTLIHDMNWES